MAEIPQWGRQGRRERREIARQVAKEILQGNPPKKTDALLGGLLWSTSRGMCNRPWFSVASRSHLFLSEIAHVALWAAKLILLTMSSCLR